MEKHIQELWDKNRKLEQRTIKLEDDRIKLNGQVIKKIQEIGLLEQENERHESRMKDVLDDYNMKCQNELVLDSRIQELEQELENDAKGAYAVEQELRKTIVELEKELARYKEIINKSHKLCISAIYQEEYLEGIEGIRYLTKEFE